MAKRSQFEQLDAVVQAILSAPESARPHTDAAFSPLVRLAEDLRDLPRSSFKTRLKADLERSTTMATPAKATESSRVNPVREGFHTITPYLIVKEADQLIEFVKEVFGAHELFRSIGSAGGIHCEVRLGDSIVMIGGGGEWRGTPTPTGLHVYVPDADAVYERALKAGATSLRPPADQFYGDRDASVRDPFGNHWYIATHGQAGTKSYVPEGLRQVTVYLHPAGAEKMIDFLTLGLGGEELARYQDSAGVVQHAKLRVGDSVLEMGEAHGEFRPMPTTFYLYVEDCDALYERALTAGATSISPPADQPYGDRNAGIQDPFGNTWYLATHVQDVPL
jgi:PhnB protein